MQISSNFNRFYHSLLREFYRQADKIIIEGVGVLYLKGLTYNNFKQALKLLNFDYPRKNNIPLSTRDITNKELVEHVEFIVKLAYQNGYKLSVVEQEWELIFKKEHR
jgi:hypothetical protein